jgi:ribosome-associated protein
MINEILKGRDFYNEFAFSTSRSSGPGGQNVNKVSSKVELKFHILNSQLLTDAEKELLLLKLSSKINSEGYLIIISQTDRSQLKNKEKAVEKFYAIVTKVLTPKKKRKPTKPTKVSIEKRLETKRLRSEKKLRRKDIDL